MTTNYQCWHCGAELKDLILPFSRRQECQACNADQHVCRMCKNYDANISGQCREDRAEDISDKEKANFCDYFAPSTQAYTAAGNSKQDAAKAKLEALFGGSDSSTVPSDNNPVDKNAKAKQALEDLFKSDD